MDYPLNEGGVVRLVITIGSSPKTFELRLDPVAQGLEVLAKDYSGQFADLINDNGDPVTADTFLQCCLIGEVCYG